MSDRQRRRKREPEEVRQEIRRRISSKADNQCSICLSIIRDLTYADGCLHPFCRLCILEWAKRSNNCPVCRTVFENVITNIKSDSSYELIPVESPPPTTIPIINIIRDIMVSHDGQNAIIRTRITNEDGTVTEITENRGLPNSSTAESGSRAIGPGIDLDNSLPPSADPQQAVEFEEFSRFMETLLQRILLPENPESLGPSTSSEGLRNRVDPNSALVPLRPPGERPLRERALLPPPPRLPPGFLVFSPALNAHGWARKTTGQRHRHERHGHHGHKIRLPPFAANFQDTHPPPEFARNRPPVVGSTETGLPDSSDLQNSEDYASNEDSRGRGARRGRRNRANNNNSNNNNNSSNESKR